MEKKAKQAETRRKKENKATEWKGHDSDDNDSDNESEMKDAGNLKEALPWKEWVVMSHERVSDHERCRFRVAMHGFPPEEGEKSHRPLDKTWWQMELGN